MLMQFILDWAYKQQLKGYKVDEDYNVEAYLNKIVEYFDPSKAGDRRFTIVYEFHDSRDNDGAWTIRIADGRCTLEKGEAELYDSKLFMTAETYRRILTGRLDYSKLTYSTGAVRFYGSTLGHRELNAYMTLPKKAGIAGI